MVTRLTARPPLVVRLVVTLVWVALMPGRIAESLAELHARRASPSGVLGGAVPLWKWPFVIAWVEVKTVLDMWRDRTSRGKHQ